MNKQHDYITTVLGLQMALNYRGNIVLCKNFDDPDGERQELCIDYEHNIVIAQ